MITHTHLDNLHSNLIIHSLFYWCLGSPILSQNNTITDRVLMPRKRRLSLVPLSPITPGDL